MFLYASLSGIINDEFIILVSNLIMLWLAIKGHNILMMELLYY